ncbi:MAG: xanthine dehydrogenase accessory protein XdhC [Sphingobium sp.]|nr:MAG: xanthine dehydrogenase accessory protein XdhC [Sphingobium sp.]
MPDWAAAAREGLVRGATALVTVLATEGSAPRGAGTRMVVTHDMLFGTIGGGALELRATEQARAVLAHSPGTWRVQDYPLGPLLGQCCGGRVRLLVERLDPDDAAWLADGHGPMIASLLPDGVARRPADEQGLAKPSARGERPDVGATFLEPPESMLRPLYLFGAGHVGQAIAATADGLPFHLAWFDSRREMADTAGAMFADEEEIVSCAAEAPADAALLILTHDHGLDYRLTASALRGNAAFVGLIGSRTKRARFLSRLEADGFDARIRARLTCPIGMPGITGKEPAVIAVAALAQLLTLTDRAA